MPFDGFLAGYERPDQWVNHDFFGPIDAKVGKTDITHHAWRARPERRVMSR